MRTRQSCGMLRGVMISLLLMIVVFTAYMAAGEEDNVGEMTLLQAAKDGDTETVKTFIESGTDVNVKDKDGMTALMWAAFGGHAEIVQEFLQAGADANVKNTAGKTALTLAEEKGHQEVVKILKMSGAKE